MEVIHSISQLKKDGKLWPQGYVDYVLSLGKIEDDKVVLDIKAQNKIRARYPAPRSGLSALKASAPYQPPGFMDFVLSRAKIDGENVILDKDTSQELSQRFPMSSRPLIYRVEHLKTNALLLPQHYVEFLLAKGKIEGDYLILGAEAKSQLDITYRSNSGRVWHKIAQIKATAYQRPKGYVEYVLAHGEISGPDVIIDTATFKKINELFPPLLTYSIETLKSDAARRPKGLAEYVLAHGRIENGYAIFDPPAAQELRRHFPEDFLPTPPEPTLTQMAKNFTGAFTDWAKAGYKIVEREVYEKRMTVCETCTYWDAKARGGMGKCRICGCTKMKFWLATSKCPHNPPKW